MTIRSYADCVALAQTRKRKLANNTYLECNPDGSYGVRLHATQVVTYYPDGRITLQSGGWRTVTTKDRMNTFSPLRVWSERGVWYVAHGSSNGAGVPYADGVTWHPDGTFTGEGEDPSAQLRLRRRARDFARDYMRAFEAGEIPPPGPGDCWGCLMRTAKGARPMGGPGHMLDHLDERYFVPSLLVNAAGGPSGANMPGAGRVSDVARWTLAARWGLLKDNEGRVRTWESLGYLRRIGLEQLRAALRRHVLEELGLPS